MTKPPIVRYAIGTSGRICDFERAAAPRDRPAVFRYERSQRGRKAYRRGDVPAGTMTGMNASRFWRDMALYMGLFTVIGLLSGSESVLSGMYLHRQFSWIETMGTDLLDWYTCALGIPLFLILVQKLPLERGRFASRLPIYVGAIALSVIVKFAIWVPLQNAIFHMHWRFVESLVSWWFGVALGLVYFLVLLYAIEYYRSVKAEQLRASQLEAQLSQTQLRTLRTQLEPHFLFNTLNSVSALMRQDVDAADDMLARLSDMLRLTLNSDGRQEIKLGEELAMTSRYLDIMRVRFRDRLVVDVDVDQPALLDELVPSFLLQPLVENTVRHGLSESSLTTHIRISAQADAENLTIRVLDNGRGLPRNGHVREGVGLRNTRRRLERLYGPLGELALSNRQDGGAEVIIKLPRRKECFAP
jgi:two-component system, LytTR family, sensor kinase